MLQRKIINIWRCRFLRQIRQENFVKMVWPDDCHAVVKGMRDYTNEGTMTVRVGKVSEYHKKINRQLVYNLSLKKRCRGPYTHRHVCLTCMCKQKISQP